LKLVFVACPFQTSYGSYTDSLKQAIEKRTGQPVEWLASNCGCGDSVEVARKFQRQDCRYFEMVNIGDFHSASSWKRTLRVKARETIYYFRARKYGRMLAGAEVVHFQQVLNAYGSTVVFNWLKQPSQAIRVITVHELDGDQTANPERNRTYNKADALIVHDQTTKDKLVKLGVDPGKVHVIFYGVELPPIDPARPRQGIVFYGGHKLMTGKGLDCLFRALALLKQKLGGDAMPRVSIHGHYGDRTSPEALKLASELGAGDLVTWLNQLSHPEAIKLYLASEMLLLPFSGGFAGYPAGLAAATGLPVIATRNAGIPDYLGDCGVWFDTGNAEQLAARIGELLASPAMRADLATRLRARAEQKLGWDTIAAQTLEIYGAPRA
jgi:glycosyltransferase involved in cell wall biosynthesis